MKDKNGQKLEAGDYVKVRDAYFIITVKSCEPLLFLVCEPGHPCENIPYAFVSEHTEKALHDDVVAAKVFPYQDEEMPKHLSRITVDPEICHGQPCIRGMRWPVEVLLDMMISKMNFEEILNDHPELEKEDLLACLEYAKALVGGKEEP